MNVVVKGFVKNMDTWMAASDLIVTKAGPGTQQHTTVETHLSLGSGEWLWLSFMGQPISELTMYVIYKSIFLLEGKKRRIEGRQSGKTGRRGCAVS